MRYNRIAKILHWAIALLISFQLLSEEFMKRPKLIDDVLRIRTDEQAWFFTGHEWFGLLLLIVVILRFVFIMDRDEWDRFFPWLKAEGRQGLIDEIKVIPSWLVGKLKDAGEQDHLAKTVHGLGLLLALALGVLGSIMFIGMNPDGTMDSFTHLCKEGHEVLGEVLWIYFYGHVFMALYHQLLGHRSLQHIFKLGDD
ncbi:MAG: cytochrome b/b6 domain-containing protein [Mariprofundaceae bacterium]